MIIAKPMTNRVYKLIYRDVVTNVFDVNQIVSESQLVKRYDSSKAPVREALISLCDKNVMKSIPRAGYQIVQILPNEVREIMETRKVIELYMLEISCPSIDDCQLAMLYNQDREMEKLNLEQMSVYEQWAKNVEFHMLLASFSNNEYMLKILKDILRDNARAAAQYHIQSGKAIIDQKQRGHQRLIQAIAAKDIEKAKKILIQDIGFFSFGL